MFSFPSKHFIVDMDIHDIRGLYYIWCNELMVFALCKSSYLYLLLKVLKDDSRFDFKIVLSFLSRCNLAQYIKFKGYWYIAFINRYGLNRKKTVISCDAMEIDLCSI